MCGFISWLYTFTVALIYSEGKMYKKGEKTEIRPGVCRNTQRYSGYRHLGVWTAQPPFLPRATQ